DRNRSHWSTSKTPSYTKSVSWQHHQNDAAHFCVTQGKKMQIVDLKTEGAGLHGVARLTFKCGE
ncbi:hypothetical protein ACQKH4_01845, partial [Escherichia coli]